MLAWFGAQSNSVGLISLLESVQAKFNSLFEEFLKPDLELNMDVCWLVLSGLSGASRRLILISEVSVSGWVDV